MVMVDAGVIGIQYASMFAVLGAKVTAVDVGASGTVTTLASDKRIPTEVITYFGWAAGPDRSSGPGRRGVGNRQPRKDCRRRGVAHPGRPYLCRRRCDRVPGA